MPSERELEQMEAVITRARAWVEKPISVELRQKVDWALRDLEALRATSPREPAAARSATGGTQ
jgi:hypothetical protein